MSNLVQFGRTTRSILNKRTAVCAAAGAWTHSSMPSQQARFKTKIKSIVKQKLKEKWLKQWEEERKGRWFYRVQRKVGEMRCAGKNRRDETIISRLKSTLFKICKHDTGRCNYCGQGETGGACCISS